MSVRIERNRVKVYDARGNLVEERDITQEDLIRSVIDELVSNYYIEFTFSVGTQTFKVKASLKRVST